jgi:hypothetical protein
VIILTVTKTRVETMKNLLKIVKQIFDDEIARYQQVRLNDENEYLAMSCGAFSPRFLAKIKRTRAVSIKSDNKNK